MVVIFWLAAIFLGVQLLTLLTNLIFFPALEPAPSDFQSDVKVSILIPARNEAENLSETLPWILEQLEASEVIVLNDNSTDDTEIILADFARNNPHLKIIQGEDLPDGWTGKNWACHQLAKAAQSDFLVFTDADVRWKKGTLASLIAFREKNKAEFLSVWPRQLTASALEVATIPIIDQILLGSLPYLGVKYSKNKAFSAGNGQLMMWTHNAYNKVGGHAAFKQEVLEDVRMGQAAKGAGLSIALAVGADMISTRMYQSDKAMIEGFSKNILAAAGSKAALLTAAILNTLTHTLSWVFIPLSPIWFVIVIMSLLLRMLTNLKTKNSPFDAFWQPLMSIPMWIIVWRALTQKTIKWKGRQYA